MMNVGVGSRLGRRIDLNARFLTVVDDNGKALAQVLPDIVAVEMDHYRMKHPAEGKGYVR